MNEVQGKRTPRIKKDHRGYDIPGIHPWHHLGTLNYWDFQIIDEAGAGEGLDPSFSGDDIAILLSTTDVPAFFMNGAITLVTPATPEKGDDYFTLRRPNDYRFDWHTRRWVAVAEKESAATLEIQYSE